MTYLQVVSFAFLLACSGKSTTETIAQTTPPDTFSIAKSAPIPVPDATKIPAPSSAAPRKTPKPQARQTAPAVELKPEAPLPMVETTKDVQLPLHAAFDSLLQQFVSEQGVVNYNGLVKNKAALDAYCLALSNNPVQDAWTQEEKMAYWINAYNAFTLKLITDHYPTKSILNFDNGKTWDVKRIRLGDRKYSLNNIENDILRPDFKDPRIHFAINCAAKSCPPLWNHAYTAENLEAALESRTSAFINNKTYNTLGATGVKVSKIFDWYSVDFGDLRAFLNRYSEQKIPNTAPIKFHEYDWDLND